MSNLYCTEKCSRPKSHHYQNKVFSLVKDVSESLTLLSHNMFGDGSYRRGVRCGAKFSLEACEEARLDCSGEGNFDVSCHGILGDHLQVGDDR